MNPRALAAWSASGVVIVLAANNPVYRILVLLAAIDVLVVHHRPDRRVRSLLTALALATGIAVLISAALSHAGTHVLFAIPRWVPGFAGPVTLESAIFGLATGIGLSAGALVVAPLSMVLLPQQLVDGLPRQLERAGAALAAAVNMVPALGRSVGEVREAQLMRGWRPRGPRSAAEILVPVTLTSLENSIQLAESMEARAFGSGPRTRWQPPRWRAADVLIAVVAGVAAAVFVAGRVTGLVSDWYPYPTPALPDVNPMMVATCLALVVPALIRPRLETGG
jgi:energy-coupling factor transport system permease protein